jgi:D-alanyl-D-alanine carboxypeptidase/D-alanyl-D-alanine-endopeptidase (penicillin-binding protein 4)
MIRLLTLWLVLAWGLSAALPHSITKMLTRNKIDPSTISLLIREVKSGNVIASQTPDRSRTPASVMKILTTYSALTDLGTSFRWPTKFYYTGRFNGGTIHGDLAIEAFGDPSLTSGDINRIAKRLRRLGVRRIQGDMIIDRTFFASQDKVTSGFDRNRYSEYNAMPDAMMLNDHMSRIVVRPRNGKFEVTKSIPNDAYDIVNYLKPTDQACRGKYGWPNIGINNKGSRPAIVVSGTLSTHCPKRTYAKLLTHSYESFYHAFRAALTRARIHFDGKMVLERIPSKARALLVHHSKPLLKVVAKTNKKSNNLYARHIFLLLGAQHEGAPATEAKGAKAIRSILSARGVWSDRIRISNGCGLSRHSYVTASALVAILQDAYKTLGKQWMNTLSIAGKDGTIKRRFKRSIAKGHAWMKTGTLNNAKNIAGYVRGKSGKYYALAILYNGREKWKGSTLQNQIIEWLVRNK